MYRDDIDTALNDLVVDNALHAEDVVSAARDPISPLHGKFEWEDSKAAQQYRLWQARKLIASVTIKLPDGQPVRKYINVTVGPAARQYEPVVLVVQDEDKFTAVLNETLRDLHKIQGKVEGLRQMVEHNAKQVAAVDVIASKATDLVTTVDQYTAR